MDRRRFLTLAGGGLGAVATGKAVDNVLLGYGPLGTNLLDQELKPLLRDGLFEGLHRFEYGGVKIEHWDGLVRLTAGEDEGDTVVTLPLDASDAEIREADARFGFDGRLRQGFTDLRALHRGEFSLVPSKSEAFFDSVEADALPLSTGFLRGRGTADPAFVSEFADADAADTRALAWGLAEGFREYSSYDIPRYLAGSVEDNVLFGAVDLREYFESPTSFEALVSGENSGLFCTELTVRSIQAFQAVAPAKQVAPVAACYVYDERHKHVYTGLVSLQRVDGGLRMPVTFVDYTHTTLYDDLNLTGVMGEGLEGYNARHMATRVLWDVH
ncbi:hypothetical protein [Natronomonas sp. EA1]|uniref:hypothetical protein n=1 Tax=Natronomonas sp. EA1 TaxID=3421655 RepID=UPI003EBCD40E